MDTQDFAKLQKLCESGAFAFKPNAADARTIIRTEGGIWEQSSIDNSVDYLLDNDIIAPVAITRRNFPWLSVGCVGIAFICLSWASTYENPALKWMGMLSWGITTTLQTANFQDKLDDTRRGKRMR